MDSKVTALERAFQLARSGHMATVDDIRKRLKHTFIEGRSKETRLALLKDVNGRVVAAAGISPDDLMITLYEAPGENFSFGQGEAQRANAVPRQ